jgi:hypothetical protein
MCKRCRCTHKLYINACMCKRCRCTHKLYINGVHKLYINGVHKLYINGVYVKLVSASAPFTHAWTSKTNRLILIILKFNIVDKNVLFLHIPGLEIAQIKIPRNVVDDFGTLTKLRHIKTSSLKRKDQYILIRFN